ncbi:MAG TPA: 2'-5' RNA ligase family protein [Caldimonas sp.]
MSQSAFIVRVPEAEPYVATLRERLDPSARLGVPAHVTLLYPFMAPERIGGAVLERARALAASSAPFAYRLAGIRRFPGVLYLSPQPGAPFVELTLRLAREFPEHPPYGGRHADIVPHLTVAQADAQELAAAEVELRAALPRSGGVAARCNDLALIENSSGRWRPVQTFPLGAGLGRIEPHTEEHIPMASKQACIVGRVTYGEGDGPAIVIRPGPCDITVTNLDVTIGWTDGDTHGSTAIPLAEYTRYVTSGAIVLGEAATAPR